MSHNFILGPVDTDSISFCKEDMSPFSDEEQHQLLNEINDLMPELIKFDHDGYFNRILVVKSKNYVLDDGEKIKFKGSSLIDQKKEPALREMLERMIHTIMDEHPEQLNDIYLEYIRECFEVSDIKRWCTKKTVTKAVFESERKNEKKVLDAIGDTSAQEGDKIWVFPVIDGMEPVLEKGEPKYLKNGEMKMKPRQVLKQIDNFNGQIDSMHLVKRVYSTVKILEHVIDISKFLNFTLSRNYDKLMDVIQKGN